MKRAKSDSMNAGAALAAGGIASSASSGNGNIGCPESDTSFYCRLSRFTKIVSMLLLLAIVFGSIAFIVYYLYYMRKSKK